MLWPFRYFRIIRSCGFPALRSTLDNANRNYIKLDCVARAPSVQVIDDVSVVIVRLLRLTSTRNENEFNIIVNNFAQVLINFPNH